MPIYDEIASLTWVSLKVMGAGGRRGDGTLVGTSDASVSARIRKSTKTWSGESTLSKYQEVGGS